MAKINGPCTAYYLTNDKGDYIWVFGENHYHSITCDKSDITFDKYLESLLTKTTKTIDVYLESGETPECPESHQDAQLCKLRKMLSRKFKNARMHHGDYRIDSKAIRDNIIDSNSILNILFSSAYTSVRFTSLIKSTQDYKFYFNKYVDAYVKLHNKMIDSTYDESKFSVFLLEDMLKIKQLGKAFNSISIKTYKTSLYNCIKQYIFNDLTVNKSYQTIKQYIDSNKSRIEILYDKMNNNLFTDEDRLQFEMLSSELANIMFSVCLPIFDIYILSDMSKLYDSNHVIIYSGYLHASLQQEFFKSIGFRVEWFSEKINPIGCIEIPKIYM